MKPLPNVLIFPFDLLSHYLRCIEWAKRYRDSYNIMFKQSAKYAELLREANLDTFDCADFEADYVMDCMRKFNFWWLNERDLDRIFFDQVRCINKYQPEFVVGDMSPTLKMAAEFTNTPFVSIINGYMSKYYELQRPITSKHPAAILQRFIPRDIFDKVLPLQERKAFERIHKPFRNMRSRFGLKKTFYYLDELEGDRTLICDHAEVFPQRSLPQSYEIVGPILYKKVLNNTLPQSLHNDKLKILVTFGSSGDWTKVMGLADPLLSEFAVFTAGDTDRILSAAHIVPLAFGDLHELLPHIDLLICHGGNGTLNYAYQYSVPFIALPSIMEQEWNAMRFREVMTGEIVTKKMSPIKLRGLIMATVQNHRETRNAQTLSGKMQ